MAATEQATVRCTDVTTRHTRGQSEEPRRAEKERTRRGRGGGGGRALAGPPQEWAVGFCVHSWTLLPERQCPGVRGRQENRKEH